MNARKKNPIFMVSLGLVFSMFFYNCKKNQVNSTASLSEPTATTGSKKSESSTSAVQSTGFLHPGILNTQKTLDYVGQQAVSNDPDRSAAYNYVLNYCNNHSASNQYKATVNVAGGYVTADETAFKGDALYSYTMALRWAKTGTASYAATVKSILDGWAGRFQNFSVSGDNPNQAYLEASWAAPTFAAAAEIIKSYVPANGQGGGWTTPENDQFTKFLNLLKDNYINHAADPGYNNNWNVSAGYAKMAIGVFEDSQTVYQNGITMIKNVLDNGLIASDGSMDREVCGSHNDYVHFQYTLTGLSYAANIEGIQGNLELYDYANQALLRGLKYHYKLIQGTATPPCTIKQGQSPSNPIWPGVIVANRHYGTTETSYLSNNYKIDANGLPNGDIGFLCWTDYTHRNVPTNFN